ncbi:MAG: carboxypeptidase-like regulatory domain-containing protein [Bacteroidota bacterium]
MSMLSVFIAVFINFIIPAGELDYKDPLNYSFSGKIIESGSGEELPGVEIEVIGTGEKYYTDFDGEFHIPCPNKEKKISIRISYISYQKQILRDLCPGNKDYIIKLQNDRKPVLIRKNISNVKA